MKTIFRTIFAAVISAGFGAVSLRAAEGWAHNYQEALSLAKKEKKLLLAEFTGSDWCPPCKAQAAEVFANPEFKEYAAKHLVLLELDFPRKKAIADDVKAQNKELSTKFKITGYPTVIMLDGEGKELARWVGYGKGSKDPAQQMIAKIDALKK